MDVIYFPEPVSGWIFFSLLMSFLAVAAVVDQRFAIVPKRVTLWMLGLGVFANLFRGGWLAAHGYPGWWWTTSYISLGALDGFLFALAGLAVGFALFFLLWMLGVCGGGDVKLFAALGAWVGPELVIWVLGLTILIVMGVVLVKTIWAIARGKLQPVRPPRDGAPRQRTLIRYSLIVLTATLPLLLWVFRTDLRLTAREQAQQEAVPPKVASNTSQPRRRRPGRKGSLTVELLVIMPILLGLLWGMVQLSLLLSAKERLTVASRQGARVAAVGGGPMQVEDMARLALGMGRLAGATVTAELTQGGQPVPTGEPVRVTVSIPVEQAVPNFLAFLGVSFANQSLEASTVMRKE